MVIIPFRNFRQEMKTSIVPEYSCDGSLILFRARQFSQNSSEMQATRSTSLLRPAKFRKHLLKSGKTCCSLCELFETNCSICSELRSGSEFIVIELDIYCNSLGGLTLFSMTMHMKTIESFTRLAIHVALVRAVNLVK